MIDIQGVPADVGGYYKLDEDKANAVMRPSKVTLWFLTMLSATISQPEFAEVQRADGQLLNSPPAQSEIHCETVINQTASSTHLRDTIIQFSAISNNCSIFAVPLCHDQEQCANITMHDWQENSAAEIKVQLQPIAFLLTFTSKIASNYSQLHKVTEAMKPYQYHLRFSNALYIVVLNLILGTKVLKWS